MLLQFHQTKKSFQNQNKIYDGNFGNYTFLPLNMRLFGENYLIRNKEK